MAFDLGHHVRRNRDSPSPSFSLCWTEHQSSVDVYNLLADVHPAVKQVDVLASKRAKLAETKAAPVDE
jgi:hypothetical protein